MEKILINDLSFAYPDEPNRLIIKDINLEIEQGEFVCLLGQSGCGKSTLLKLLAGLQKPSQGEITIDGDPIKGASLERTVVFQDYGLFPWMTAGENILLGFYVKRYSTLGLYQKVWGGFIFMVLVLVIVMTFFERIKNRMLKWTIN